MIAMFTSVSVFGEWAAETEAAGNGTGAGLRAKLARGCPIETEMRPNSMALFGRMKYNYRFWIELFHIDCRNYPSKGAGFFKWFK